MGAALGLEEEEYAPVLVAALVCVQAESGDVGDREGAIANLEVLLEMGRERAGDAGVANVVMVGGKGAVGGFNAPKRGYRGTESPSLPTRPCRRA